MSWGKPNETLSSRMLSADPVLQTMTVQEARQQRIATGNHAQDVLTSAKAYAEAYQKEIDACQTMGAIDKELQDVTTRLKAKYSDAQEAYKKAQADCKQARDTHLDVFQITRGR